MVAWLVALVVAVAVSAVAQLLVPRPKQPRPEAAKDLEDPTAEAGRPIPKAWGTITISGLNVLWYGDKSSNTYQVKA